MSVAVGVATSTAALATFVVYIAAVFVLAAFSNRLLRRRAFLSEYFLGSRSLGLWAFAFTFAATGASGGSFTGFPSKIYVHGWILGLWIASYLVYPICTMGFLGKRLNQVARISGAITIPDVLRARFRSRELGWIAVTLIVFFMAFNLVAQFKSGSEILRTLLRDIPFFHACSAWLAQLMSGVGFAWFQGVPSDYALCLLIFGVSVIAYTTYGGFHAVVWTDVMQGIVMLLGVLILVPLTIWQVGGLTRAGKQLAQMTPPHYVLLDIELDRPLDRPLRASASWLLVPGSESPRLMRLGRDWTIPAGVPHVRHLAAVELTTPSQIEELLERLSANREGATPDHLRSQVKQSGQALWLDPRLEEELGPRAHVWVTRTLEYAYGADRQGVYASGPGPTPPAFPAHPGTIEVTGLQPGWQIRVVDASGRVVEQRTVRRERELWGVEGAVPGQTPVEYRIEVQHSEDRWAEHRVSVKAGEVARWDAQAEARWQSGAWGSRSALASASDGFLPLGLAFSFFFMWAISGTGQPGYMVRLMAFRETSALRRGIVVVSFYYGLIYFPLVIIFVCARLLLPGMELESDRIMPQMAVTVTGAAGHPWLAGLLIAAPFAAVMSTVDSFLLVISSGLVRDIYQRSVNPRVSDKTVKRLSYTCTLVVGLAAALGALNPPRFLQDIIVYTGSGLAACFLAPMVYALYSPSTTKAGAIAGMVGGFAAHLAMYLAGWAWNGSFYQPYKLWGLDPVVVGLTVSFLAVPLVSRWTPACDPELVRRFFMKPVAGR